MSPFRFIFKYLKKTKAMAGVVFVSLIVNSFSNRGEIFAMSEIIGMLPKYAENKAVLHEILLYICLLGAFLFLTTLSNVLWRYVGGNFMPYFLSLVYKDIFSAVHHHSVRFFNEEMAGKITAKAKNIVSGIREIYGQIVFGIIRPVSGIFITLFLIIRADWLLGIWCLC